jgi:hypothetical protein
VVAVCLMGTFWEGGVSRDKILCEDGINEPS